MNNTTTNTTTKPSYNLNCYGANAYVAPVAKVDNRPKYHVNIHGSAYLTRPAGS
jgi:hypothetical protein